MSTDILYEFPIEKFREKTFSKASVSPLKGCWDPVGGDRGTGAFTGEGEITSHHSITT